MNSGSAIQRCTRDLYSWEIDKNHDKITKTNQNCLNMYTQLKYVYSCG